MNNNEEALRELAGVLAASRKEIRNSKLRWWVGVSVLAGILLWVSI